MRFFRSAPLTYFQFKMCEARITKYLYAEMSKHNCDSRLAVTYSRFVIRDL